MKRHIIGGPAAAAGLVLAAGLLAGCGGRVARPVEAMTPLDGRLTCTHIVEEIRVNNARAADLAGEKDAQSGNNAGLILVAPMFINLDNTEGREVQALHARNQVLADLASKKACKL